MISSPNWLVQKQNLNPGYCLQLQAFQYHGTTYLSPFRNKTGKIYKNTDSYLCASCLPFDTKSDNGCWLLIIVNINHLLLSMETLLNKSCSSKNWFQSHNKAEFHSLSTGQGYYN